MSRNLKELHPKVRVLCEEFIDACKNAGIDVIITSTFRSVEDQDALYAKGRTKPGRRVTNAKGGQSFHNFGVAFDFAPIKHGKIDWNNTELFKQCGAIAKSIGLEYAGDWKRFREYAHCQYTGGLTLRDFNAGKHLA